MEQLDQDAKIVLRPQAEESINLKHNPDEELQQALQTLVEEVQRSHAEGVHGDSKELIFDITVNGVHYTVARNGKVVYEEKNSLSPREKEIVRLIARGLPNKAIASVLEMSPWTVASHLRRIYAKLGVKSRAEMIAQVYGTGLLDESGQKKMIDP
jgi:DNA-binding CsgD family transcriptional regulator